MGGSFVLCLGLWVGDTEYKLAAIGETLDELEMEWLLDSIVAG